MLHSSNLQRLKGAGGVKEVDVLRCADQRSYSTGHEEPFYAPDVYITMECPEMFKWVIALVSCVFYISDRVIHYRIGKSQTDHG